MPATTSPAPTSRRRSTRAATPAPTTSRRTSPSPGDAFGVVRGHDVVIHGAALPEPTRNPPHTVFRNNLMATFNVAEACVRMGADRIVNVSSETVAGMAFAERRFHAPYAPIDEDLPNRPQDPYALAKVFGEQLMDAVVARSDLRAISIRPSWVQWEGNYERGLGPWLRDPFGGPPSESFWSYIDIYDLAHALRLAAESSLDGHEAMYVASPGQRRRPAAARSWSRTTSARRWRCGSSRARTRAGSRRPRPSGCSATARRARGAITSRPRARSSTRFASG